MWAGIDTKTIHANGIDFEVAVSGQGLRMALLLHGFPEHAISWRRQIPALVDLGYQVWAPNLRGYGNSSSPPEIEAYRLETLMDDIAGLIAESGYKQVTLIAHDWGAVIAWFLAMRRPDLIERLVIMNLPHPALFAREIKGLEQMLKSWYIAFFQIPSLPEWALTRDKAQGIRAAFLNMAVNKHRFPDAVLDVYAGNALRPGGMRAMINYYRSAARGGGMARQVALGFPIIKIPTLMIWGEQDTALSRKTTIGTEDYVADLTLRYLPQASHWVQQDAPDEVNAILTAWLKNEVVPRFDR
jgi:pimeloyl-ACP methyl ester carboxylesterase